MLVSLQYLKQGVFFDPDGYANDPGWYIRIEAGIPIGPFPTRESARIFEDHICAAILRDADRY